jgi:hypothetical protein
VPSIQNVFRDSSPTMRASVNVDPEVSWTLSDEWHRSTFQQARMGSKENKSFWLLGMPDFYTRTQKSFAPQHMVVRLLPVASRCYSSPCIDRRVHGKKCIPVWALHTPLGFRRPTPSVQLMAAQWHQPWKPGSYEEKMGLTAWQGKAKVQYEKKQRTLERYNFVHHFSVLHVHTAWFIYILTSIQYKPVCCHSPRDSLRLLAGLCKTQLRFQLSCLYNQVW